MKQKLDLVEGGVFAARQTQRRSAIGGRVRQKLACVCGS